MKLKSKLSIFSKEYSKNLDPNSTKDGIAALRDNISQLKEMLDNLEKSYENKPKDENYSKLVKTLNTSIEGVESQVKVLKDFKKKEDEQIKKAKQEIQNNKDQLSKARSFLELNTQDGADTTALVGACFSGALAAIPPSFCLKKGADAGKIPTGCPSGYFRSMALCYQNCKNNYTFVLGVCWEECKGGYKDMGLTCLKWDWFKSKSYGKGSYIPSSVTNFSSLIPCQPGMYKGGALCYRDCENIGLANCGIGACAANGAACGVGIGTMAVDFFLSMVQFVAFVASFGTSSAGTTGFAAAKQQLVSGFKKIGKSAIENGLQTIKKFATKSFLRSLLKKEARNAAKKSIQKAVLQKLGEGLINTVCDSVVDSLLDKSQTTASSIDLTLFDPTGISGAVVACKNAGSNATSNENAACAKGVLSAVSNFDPTGIVGMAAALIQDTCDVPSSPPS